jgi:Carboxypeptidase regulatory-like domain/TonB dependent receptor
LSKLSRIMKTISTLKEICASCTLRTPEISRFGILILALIVVTFASPAQDFRGILVGSVEDSTGARITGAKIVVHALGSSIERQATSGADGEFRIDNLDPGTYRVIVNAQGLAEARADVDVVVSTTREIKVTMRPASLQQSVSVQGTASSITTQSLDTTSAVHGGAVTAQDLQKIPLANRSFANIAYLIPGTEPVEPSDPTKARITAVSTGGSSGLNNVLSVDGGDDSDDFIGGFLQNFSPDTIQEFVVRTAGEDADTGRTTAASVVITTKRGSDNWHGDGAFYERAADLNARYPIENPAPNPKQPFLKQNYIGTIGGPVLPGKLWFFTSLEYVHENASIAYSPASTDQFQALASLAQQGLIPGVSSIDVPNSTPIPFRDYLATTRLDWAQSIRSQWFLRAAVDNYTTQNALVQQATLPSTGATWRSNYMNLVIGQEFTFSPTWQGSFTSEASGLHLTEKRNSDLGFALAFPFSSTSQTISGFETFGDQQFVTAITAFPIVRNQEKYQFRYDVSHTMGKHAPRFGIDFIHEPVLSGALPGTAESLFTFPNDPTFYLNDTADFAAITGCNPAAPENLPPNPGCPNGTFTPAGNGSFGQNVQRLGMYAEDTWRIAPRLVVNYGLRYDTTFGLFTASGQAQTDNATFLTLQALQIPLLSGAPHDYRHAFGPRLGVVYSPGQSSNTVFRAGFGFYFNDLAQNGWVSALQAVNAPPLPCVITPGSSSSGSLLNESAGCLPGGAPGAEIAPNYKTPYALHATAGIEHSFNKDWMISADYTHEQGNHGFARYQYTGGFTLFTPLFATSDFADQSAVVPSVAVFRSDNRSSYNALMIHLQGNVTHRFNLIANYTLSRASTWGCVLGELFDYVDGVCNPLNPFGPGDYGPSGEDVTHRFVIAGIFHVPGGVELSLLGQAESGRPITLTTPVDVNGLGDPADDRAVVNGFQTTLDQLRGTPYIQFDLRITRPIKFGERWELSPFVEFFNIFNRNNPGANYVTDISALPTPVNNLYNATAFCLNAGCSQLQPITSLNQLRVPSGALGDFFGPGTTVGIPFAAQLGIRLTF